MEKIIKKYEDFLKENLNEMAFTSKINIAFNNLMKKIENMLKRNGVNNPLYLDDRNVKPKEWSRLQVLDNSDFLKSIGEEEFIKGSEMSIRCQGVINEINSSSDLSNEFGRIFQYYDAPKYKHLAKGGIRVAELNFYVDHKDYMTGKGFDDEITVICTDKNGWNFMSKAFGINTRPIQTFTLPNELIDKIEDFAPNI